MGIAKDPDVTGGPVESARPLRADAARNRAKVLEAAEEVFASEGIDVPVDTIADRAGVGVGTLYRHFPTKERLYEAILVERVRALTAEAQRLGADDPEDAFFVFLEYLVGEASRKRDLINAFESAGVEFDVVAAEAKEALATEVARLLVAAQNAGTVRPDVTAPLVLSLIGATCSATGHMPAGVTSTEMLAVVADGLRPSAVVGSR